MRQDASVLRHTIKPGTTKRALRFAAPYLPLLSVFLVVVAVDAAIGIANPLIYRAIINQGILKGNSSLVIRLAVLVGILAIFDGALGLTQSYLSAKIGARTVLSLRTRLFEHIQQMPPARRPERWSVDSTTTFPARRARSPIFFRTLWATSSPSP
jgi:ATP-binding cassette subfamily B protein